MTRGLLLPLVGPDPVELAVRAEALGYGSVWLGELWGSSAVVTLTGVATQTADIELGTAILNVFSRTPAVLAMTAASLDEASDGRFTLGVGTSTPKAVEDLHSMSFENPVRRAHEAIELTKRFLSTEGQVDYDGEVFHAADFSSLGADVPIYHAALGKANRRVVARLCDGWIPHNIPFPDLGDAFDYIRDHTPEDRDPDDITVMPYVPSAVSEDPEEARDAVRGHIAYYVGNGEGYRTAVAGRFPDEADCVAEAWRSGEREKAADHVTDEMVAALGVAGTSEEAREQFDAVESLPAVDRPLVTIPNNSTHLAEQTVEALAPDAT
ncbi:LLM class flavin-dependent oxidoreductase [Halorarius litoreus]|uniref:LLM class flavin-dependent oxidoreductase n=1 Tax=Halorarius litoreus TaxID=2962676 RepID=UPI0020CF7004|nr:LLM class flavin-dependent oxidoreductase [Halorarius litoreus]